ncbi:MAG TPA: helix-turn-helix transcriptional regulator [Gemmataceae bacterium]|nr:helix-turn-helix transcriptional regulator [Gemmataceae bacterium]
MTFEQRKELIEWLSKNKGEQKRVALELRGQGKTQAQAAELVGVDQSTLSRWEGDKLTTNMQSHNGCQKIPTDSEIDPPSGTQFTPAPQGDPIDGAGGAGYARHYAGRKGNRPSLPFGCTDGCKNGCKNERFKSFYANDFGRKNRTKQWRMNGITRSTANLLPHPSVPLSSSSLRPRDN